jgi:hypothetical protein
MVIASTSWPVMKLLFSLDTNVPSRGKVAVKHS